MAREAFTEGLLSTVIDDCHVGHNTLKLGILCDSPPQTTGQVLNEPLTGLDATEFKEQLGLLGDEAADSLRSIPVPANAHWPDLGGQVA